MTQFAVGDRVRVIGGRYLGWSGDILRIGKNGVAVVNITGIPGILIDLEDEITAGVALEKLEPAAEPRGEG